MFSQKLLLSLSSFKVNARSSKFLVCLPDKNYKDKPSAKNLPTFAWNKSKEDTSKASRIKMKTSTVLKNCIDNASFTGEKEKRIWLKSRRKNKSLRLSWKRERKKNMKPKNRKRDCSTLCINPAFILTSWPPNLAWTLNTKNNLKKQHYQGAKTSKSMRKQPNWQ